MDEHCMNLVSKNIPELADLLIGLSRSILDKMSIQHIDAGTVLYQEEDWDNSPLYVILYGVCKLYSNHESVHFPLYCPKGSVIGTLETLSDGFTPRTASLSAFTDVILLIIPQQLVHNDIYKTSKNLLFWLMRSTIYKYHLTGLRYTIRGDVCVKLCAYLCDVYSMCYESTGGAVTSILFRDTQITLAYTIGASLRSVARSLDKMKQLGLIETRGNRLFIAFDHYQRTNSFIASSGGF